ncbi:histidine kinase [Enterococcus sp.]|uniref:sensor histidine kinase n=1 Tax=Enterococcus sp. TaxID=35783 RepID=UPI00289D55E7|nr:histidine kinase [Enterococcus sp.]
MDKRRTLTESALLLLVSLFVMISQGFAAQQVIYLLTAVFLMGIGFLLPKSVNWILILSTMPLCYWWPDIAYYLPPLLRILSMPTKRFEAATFFVYSATLLLLPLSAYQGIIVMLLAISLYLRQNDRAMTTLGQDFLASTDDHWEKQQQLALQNKQLLDSHETQLALQIAEERNRIARDIHDNVGHLLSRALLQIGALETINQEPVLEEPLAQLKQTVDTGMDHIRLSVHDLHADSLSFSEAFQNLLMIEHLCPVEIQGSLFTDLTDKQHNCLSMVIKEALTNTLKHSQATLLTFHFKTLPAFYRLQIRNNGIITNEQYPPKTGIGLQTIQQRIRLINGQVHIAQTDTHFQLTITIPKEPTK